MSLIDFMGCRLSAITVASPLLAAGYATLHGAMLISQGPSVITIDIVGTPDPIIEIIEERERQDWMQQQIQHLYQWQLEASYGLSPARAEKFSRWIRHAVNETGVPFNMLSSVIATESSFRYKAESWAGAVGPAQVIPRYWGSLCEGDLTQPDNNILCGAKILMHYHQDYCDQHWPCTLSHYNVGPGNLLSGDPFYQAAAQRYITKVTDHLNQIAYY